MMKDSYTRDIFDVRKHHVVPLSTGDGCNETDTEGYLNITGRTFSCLLMG